MPEWAPCIDDGTAVRDGADSLESSLLSPAPFAASAACAILSARSSTTVLVSSSTVVLVRTSNASKISSLAPVPTLYP